jgi:hypothetical protein
MAHAFLAHATRSFMMCEGRKLSTRRGWIGTSSPVLGLRPIRAPFCRTEKVPKDEIFTVSPATSASDMCCRTLSTSWADSLRDRPTSRNTASLYQRSTTAPQASPPPIASVSSRSPGLKPRFHAAATDSASGIEAAEVLPWSCTVTTTRSIGRPSFARSADDAQVGLVRHDPVTSAAVSPALSSALRRCGQLLDRVAEDLLALHPHMHPAVPVVGDAAIDIEDVVLACRPNAGRSTGCRGRGGAGAGSAFQDHRAGAVAEQHAGRPVGPVEDAAEGLGADHHDARRLPGQDQALALASA